MSVCDRYQVIELEMPTWSAWHAPPPSPLTTNATNSLLLHVLILSPSSVPLPSPPTITADHQLILFTACIPSCSISYTSNLQTRHLLNLNRVSLIPNRYKVVRDVLRKEMRRRGQRYFVFLILRYFILTKSFSTIL